MASPTWIGSLSEFSAESESFSSYVERVKLYLDANDVKVDKRLAVFLSVIGATTYSLLRDLVAPRKPSELKLDEAIEALTAHFQPKPIVIAERFHFHCRSQLPGETVADFVAHLRRLSKHCEFGTFLEDSLRDRLDCGLRSEAMQKRLLSEKDLTFRNALDMAQAMESAAQNTRALQQSGGSSVTQHSGSTPSVSVNKVKASRSASKTITTTPQQRQQCSRCNRAGHIPPKCPFLNATCHKCKKQGHISPACRSKMSSSSSATPHSAARRQPFATHVIVESEEVKDSQEEDLHLFRVSRSSPHVAPIMCSVIINGQTLEMQVDTGADVSIISEQTSKQLFPQLTPTPARVKLKTYTNEDLQVVGKLPVTVEHNNQRVQLDLLVVAGNGPSLMGRNWL